MTVATLKNYCEKFIIIHVVIHIKNFCHQNYCNTFVASVPEKKCKSLIHHNFAIASYQVIYVH